jgi:hypothetical protein
VHCRALLYSLCVLGVACSSPKAKITKELVAEADALNSLPEKERGDLEFEAALGPYDFFAFLAPVGWDHDGPVYKPPAGWMAPVTYTVKNECPKDGCKARTDAEWRAYFTGESDQKEGGTGEGSSVEESPPGTFYFSRGSGISTRDGSNGVFTYLVAKWNPTGKTSKVFTCETVVDMTGEALRSPKRAIIPIFERACRALAPAF